MSHLTRRIKVGTLVSFPEVFDDDPMMGPAPTMTGRQKPAPIHVGLTIEQTHFNAAMTEE